MTGYATPPGFDPSSAETVLEPGETGEGNWAGAPCVHRHGGETYLGVRDRVPDARGRKVTIYRRTGRAEYEPVTSITAEDLDVVSIERPALVTDPDTGRLKLYLPVDHGANQWTIQKLGDVPSPEAFDPSTAHDVLRPKAGGSDRATVKDPYVLTVGGRYYMFYSGNDTRSEQGHLATSVDGETWQRSPNNPILERGYWHDHHTRVSCVIPAPDAPVWLVFYDGSGLTDEGRTWNLRTGLAVSSDLEEFVDTTPDGPVYQASAGDARIGVDTFETCRYVDILSSEDGWEMFAEVAREDGSFELRRQRVDPETGQTVNAGDQHG
ncbi:glycoside hydrolase family protein [Halorhabdus amylolytica]|uniref:hypothetical protein n=1 Tax=Halorhabdus amylolytica TaxID=2559573 RepID=UPI0010A9D699|nr:hypothetical protein [Halorhabdus amylolytica]